MVMLFLSTCYAMVPYIRTYYRSLLPDFQTGLECSTGAVTRHGVVNLLLWSLCCFNIFNNFTGCCYVVTVYIFNGKCLIFISFQGVNPRTVATVGWCSLNLVLRITRQATLLWWGHSDIYITAMHCCFIWNIAAN